MCVCVCIHWFEEKRILYIIPKTQYSKLGNQIILDLRNQATGLLIFNIFPLYDWLSLQFYVSVNNCEGSAISSSFQAPKSACTALWVLLGQRQMTLLFTAIAVGRRASFVPVHWIPVPTGPWEVGRWHSYTCGFWFKRGTLTLGNLIVLWQAVNMSAFCPRGRHYFHYTGQNLLSALE